MAAALRLVLRPPWCMLPLGLALAVVAIHVLAAWLPGPLRGLLIMVSMLGLWLVLFALAGRLLRQRAAGARLARERRAIELPEGAAWKQVLLWLIFSILLAVAQAGGGPVGLLTISLLAAVSLPGATLTLTCGRPLIDALYPVEWLKSAREIGPRTYLSLSGWVMVFALIYLLLAAVTAELPAWLRNALQMGWWSLTLLAWSAALGMAVHAAGKPAAARPRRKNPPAPSNSTEMLDQVLREGGDTEAHRTLARRLAAEGNTEGALQHGQVYIPALLQTFERPAEAVEQADRLLALDGEFCLDDPVMMRHLIKAAAEQAPADLVTPLCRNYLTRFRSSLVREDIYLTACESLARDGLLHSEAGRQWLSALDAADLDAKQADRLEKLHVLMDKSSAAAPR